MTLTYNQAVALKEAGFPQKNINPCEECSNANCPINTYENHKGVYIPTLEELIEECGSDFMLTNECGKWEAWSGNEHKYVRMGEGGAEFECEGSTAIEALFNLYLALHKK